MQGRDGLAWGIGLLLLAGMVFFTLEVTQRPRHTIPKVTIGTKDEIYYSHAATTQDAMAMGHALQAIGYFGDRGAAVLLSKNAGGTVVSFVVQQGLWNSGAAVASFEEIGRRVATTAGGFPLEIRLVDSAWNVQKALQVGKIRIGSRDEIYYLGSATEGDAKALGLALQAAGYLKDQGVSVSVSKGDGTAIGFVVSEGVWEQPEAVAGFERLARKVAPAVSALPIQVRLLSPQMEIKTQEEIR
jgi:hypothetical protein